MAKIKKGHLFIVNTTKGTNLGHAELADSFFSRLQGLMFKKNLEKGLILKMPSGRGRSGSALHMFFMRIPLDVVFLDEDRVVVDTVTLKPWTTYTPQKASRYVMEFSVGVIKDSSTEIGDKMDFTCANA
ncbi:MAG: DUF192 domain-containing protein [Methanobacteriaceae archaeon]|nr:DUF192 domain-containing protein [Methanobacteriaceae archaeon]